MSRITLKCHPRKGSPRGPKAASPRCGNVLCQQWIGSHRRGDGVGAAATLFQQVQPVHVLPHRCVVIFRDDEHGDFGRVVCGLSILHLVVKDGSLLILFVLKNGGLFVRIRVVSWIIRNTESSLMIIWMRNDEIRLGQNISKTVLAGVLEDLAYYGWK